VTTAIAQEFLPPKDASEVDPLRLTYCPQCDYSLEGLPAEGTCPECGYQYDQSFVVIRAGSPASRFAIRFGQTGAWIVRTLPMLMWLFVMVFLLRTRSDPLTLLMYGYLVFMAGWELFDRWLSPRPQHLLVWIAPDGIGQSAAVDPKSEVTHVRRWLAWAFVIFYFAIAFVRHPDQWAVGVIMLAVIAGLTALFGLGSRVKIARPAAEVRPALLCWTSLRKVRIWRFRGDYHRLRAESKGFLTTYPIDVVFGATSEQIGELRSRLVAWSGGVFGIEG